MIKHSFLAVCMFIGLVSSPVDAKPKGQKEAERLLKQTPADFAGSVSIKNSPADTIVTITTEPGFQEKMGLLNVINHDIFIRAFIDKKRIKSLFKYMPIEGIMVTGNFMNPLTTLYSMKHNLKT